MVGVGEPVDPLGGGGELDPVAGLAGPDRDAGGQVGLAGAGRAEEDHVLFGGDEVQRAEVGDLVAFEAAGMVEVEVLQRFAGREPGGSDPAFAAVGVAGGDLTLQAGGQELLMAPRLGAGPLGQPVRPPPAATAPSTPGSDRPVRRSCPERSRGSWWPSGHPAVEVSDAEDGVVVSQVPGLDLHVSARPDQARHGRGAAASAATRCSASLIVWCLAHTRWMVGDQRPSHHTRTRSRSARTRIRRPTADGCTE